MISIWHHLRAGKVESTNASRRIGCESQLRVIKLVPFWNGAFPGSFIAWRLSGTLSRIPVPNMSKYSSSRKSFFWGKSGERLSIYWKGQMLSCQCKGAMQGSITLGPLGWGSSGYQKLGPAVQTHIKMDCSHLHIQSQQTKWTKWLRESAPKKWGYRFWSARKRVWPIRLQGTRHWSLRLAWRLLVAILLQFLHCQLKVTVGCSVWYCF